MNFFAILLDKEARFWIIIIEGCAYVCADVDGSRVGALDGADSDLDVPTTRQ